MLVIKFSLVLFSKMYLPFCFVLGSFILFKGDVTIEICVYDIIKSKIQRVAVTSIPLQTQVCCHSFSPDNEKLMLGCIDGSVVLFDEGRGITHLIKAAFVSIPIWLNRQIKCTYK